MEKYKKVVFDNFEVFIVGIILTSIAATHHLVTDKIPFLNFYYLPVFIAGYYLGRRKAVMTAFASILFTFLYALTLNGWQSNYETISEFISALAIWGGFLTLSAILVGTLSEQKEEKIEELKIAYIGVLEILSKYLESGDPLTKSHSIRVAELSIKIAEAMLLNDDEIENIRAAALLHDIGKVEIGIDLINKSVDLTEDEKILVDEHTERGAKLIELAGGILKHSVPLVLAHHDHYIDDEHGRKIPLGARILSVADAYDAIVSDRPYRIGKEPWQALEELQKSAGSQFDPQVVDVLKGIVSQAHSVNF